MAQIVTITNPLTGQPAQVDQLDHTAQQIDDGLNIARGVSNPNLLDNWYFGNPVNQRNVSGTIDTVGYFLDRWKLVSGSVTIGSNGITLNGTIVQILETAVGTDVPASALTTEGVVVASYDNNSKTFSLTGTGQTFVAAKLELGSQQTLAHHENGNWVLNEIPDYGEQLARCKRYFQRLECSVKCNSYSSHYGMLFHVPLQVPMRTKDITFSKVNPSLPIQLTKDFNLAWSGDINLSISRGLGNSLVQVCITLSDTSLYTKDIFLLCAPENDNSYSRIDLIADL